MTSPIERDFPNIERLLAVLFANDLGGWEHVGTETPGDLESKLPYLLISRVEGTRTHQFDYPIVELDYFDADELTGAPAASRIANRLLAKPPPHPALDLVSCEPTFRELPWGDNENLRRWGATFFFQTRMVRVAP